jgi:hypothetical protein
MKLLALLLTMATTNAFAQIDYDEEIIIDSTQIYVDHLNCILPQGNPDRIFTDLKALRIDRIKEIKMEHTNATTIGCDSIAIQKLAKDSWMRFGFIQVKVKIAKGVSKDSRIVFGKCQRNYKEQVIFEFDHGLTLKTSPKGKRIPANDC